MVNSYIKYFSCHHTEREGAYMPAQRVNTICMQVKINLLFQRKIIVGNISTLFYLHFWLKVIVSKDFHPFHSSGLSQT